MDERISALENSIAQTYEGNWIVSNLASPMGINTNYSVFNIPTSIIQRITKISLLFNSIPNLLNNGTDYPVKNVQQYMQIAAGTKLVFTSDNPNSSKTSQGIEVTTEYVKAFNSYKTSGWASAFSVILSFQAFVTVYYK